MAQQGGFSLLGGGERNSSQQSVKLAGGGEWKSILCND